MEYNKILILIFMLSCTFTAHTQVVKSINTSLYNWNDDPGDLRYNYYEDPHEMNNLIGTNPEGIKYKAKAEELRLDLLDWLKKNGSKNYEGVRNRMILKL